MHQLKSTDSDPQSWLELSFGVGMILGPSVGGVTYEWSGFALPFLLFAGLSLASAALYAASYPSLDPVTGGELLELAPTLQPDSKGPLSFLSPCLPRLSV